MVLHSSSITFFYLVILLVVFMHGMLPIGGQGYFGKIGVDIGLDGDNIIPPQQIVGLLQSKGIRRARIYDAKASVLEAFAWSYIDLIVSVPNEAVPLVAKSLDEGKRWVHDNIEPYPNTSISSILVGNEWLGNPKNDPSLLVPAIVSINCALAAADESVSARGIKVSTAHDPFSILANSSSESPPSRATFKPEFQSIIREVVAFLRETGSYFMANLSPYKAYVNDRDVSLEFALFESWVPFKDKYTNLTYFNVFDIQMDAVYAAIAALEDHEAAGMANLRPFSREPKQHPEVYSGDGGWSSSRKTGTRSPGLHGVQQRANSHDTMTPPPICKCNAATVHNAKTFNQNFINHVLQASGTPAHPYQPITAYIYELFDEDLKPDGIEQHYGFFNPDGSSKYPLIFNPKI